MRDRQIMKNRKDYYGIKWAEWYLLVFDSVFTVKVFFNSGTYFFSWHRHMLVNVRWSQAFQFILMQFFFKKHDLDPPQISYINFPAFDWSLWCSSWFATVSQSALKKNCVFGFWTPLLGCILILETRVSNLVYLWSRLINSFVCPYKKLVWLFET